MLEGTTDTFQYLYFFNVSPFSKIKTKYQSREMRDSQLNEN